MREVGRIQRSTIAIIGAGISGLSCANRLSEQGHQVSLFERSQTRYGRIATKRVNGLVSDNGAQYFTCRSEHFRKVCDDWLQQGVIQQWDVVCHKATTGKIISSPDQECRYVGVPSMRKVGEALLDRLSDSQHYIDDCDIKRISRVSGQWQLEDSNNQLHGGFDWVVLAMTSEQSQRLLVNSELSEFGCRPDLHDPCWSITLHYQEPLARDVKAAFVDDPMIRWVSLDSSKPGRNHDRSVYVIHLTSQWSREHQNLSQDNVISLTIARLKLLFNRELEPSDGIAHLWRFAIPKVDHEPTDHKLFPESRLALAGDWLYSGRVENAFLSGYDIANALHQRVNSDQQG